MSGEWLDRAAAVGPFLSLILPSPDVRSALPVSDVVARLRNRLADPPLVVLATKPGERSLWTVPRMLTLSRGLRAPVVRAGDGEDLSPDDLTGLVHEPLSTPGLHCVQREDVVTPLAPPSAGLVFWWRPTWSGDVPGDILPGLAEAAGDARTTSVLITWRASASTTLRRVDLAVERLAALLPSSAGCTCASPYVAGRTEDVLVTVIQSERRR